MKHKMVLAPIKRVLWPVVVLGITAVAAAPAFITVWATGDPQFWALLMAIMLGGGWIAVAVVVIVLSSAAHFVQWMIAGESEIFFMPWDAVEDFFRWLSKPGMTSGQLKRKKQREQHEKSLRLAAEAEEARIRPYLAELDKEYPGATTTD